MSDREMVAAEAYQVIGALASSAGLFEHPEIQRALDYFSADEQDGSILPFVLPGSVVSTYEREALDYLKPHRLTDDAAPVILTAGKLRTALEILRPDLVAPQQHAGES